MKQAKSNQVAKQLMSFISEFKTIEMGWSQSASKTRKMIPFEDVII